MTGRVAPLSLTRSPMMVKEHRVVKVPAELMRPGYIILEGVVYAVRPVNHGFMLDTVNAAVFAREGETVQVYAQIATDMAKAIADTIDEDEAAYKTSVRTGVWP